MTVIKTKTFENTEHGRLSVELIETEYGGEAKLSIVRCSGLSIEASLCDLTLDQLDDFLVEFDTIKQETVIQAAGNILNGIGVDE